MHQPKAGGVDIILETRHLLNNLFQYDWFKGNKKMFTPGVVLIGSQCSA